MCLTLGLSYIEGRRKQEIINENFEEVERVYISSQESKEEKKKERDGVLKSLMINA